MTTKKVMLGIMGPAWTVIKIGGGNKEGNWVKLRKLAESSPVHSRIKLRAKDLKLVS